MDRPRRTWSLETTVEQVDGGAVVAARGRIGSVTAGTFAAAVMSAIGTTSRLVIDLQEVDYISGAGIAVLHDATTHSGQVILCGLRDSVRITLELAGLLQGVTVLESRDSAVRELRAMGDQ